MESVKYIPLKVCFIDLRLSAGQAVASKIESVPLTLSRAEIWVFFTQKLRMLLDWTPSIMVCFLVTDSGGNSWCPCETAFYDISFDCDQIHKLWLIVLWIYLKQDLSTWWKVQNETGEFEFLRSTRTKTSEIDIWEPFYETCWHDSYPRWHNPPIHSVGCRCKKTTEEVVIRKWALLIQFSSHSNNAIETKLYFFRQLCWLALCDNWVL